MNILLVSKDRSEIEELKLFLYSLNNSITVLVAMSCEEADQMFNNYRIDLLLLDLLPHDYHSLMLCERIREREGYFYLPIICMVDNEQDMLFAFRNIHCYDCLLRPIKRNYYQVMLEPVVKSFENASKPLQRISIKKFNEIKVIAFDEISYVEVNNKDINVVNKDKVIEYTNISLKDILNKLDDSFVQVHKSYIVNTKKIVSIDIKEKFIMLRDCKEKIPLGTKYLPEIMGIEIFFGQRVKFLYE